MILKYIQDIAEKNGKKMYGDYIPLEKFWETIYECLKEGLTFFPNAMLEQDIVGAFIIICADGAVHTNIGKNKN